MSHDIVTLNFLHIDLSVVILYSIVNMFINMKQTSTTLGCKRKLPQRKNNPRKKKLKGQWGNQKRTIITLHSATHILAFEHYIQLITARYIMHVLLLT